MGLRPALLGTVTLVRTSQKHSCTLDKLWKSFYRCTYLTGTVQVSTRHCPSPGELPALEVTTAAEVMAGLLRSETQPDLGWGQGSLWSHQVLLREASWRFHPMFLLKSVFPCCLTLMRCPRCSSERCCAPEQRWL